MKLDTAGAHLWSTYLGGGDYDRGSGIAVDSNGNVYATGYTWSPGWVSNGWDTSNNDDGYDDSDGFVVKLNTAGTHLWSTYLGGTDYEDGSGIAVDSGGNIYATGITESSGWMNGGWDITLDGYSDGYVLKIIDPANAF